MWFTKLINSYLMKQFLISFLNVLLIIMGIILLFDTIELLKSASSREALTFFIVMKMAICKLPQMVDTVLPFVVMISSMTTFWKLTKSNELIVMRAAGVSVWEFIFPIILATFILGVFNIFIFNPISASMYKHYEHLQDEYKMRKVSPLFFSQNGLWLREAKGDNTQIVVHSKQARQENIEVKFRSLSIIELKEHNQLVERIEADTATLREGYFELKDAWRIRPGKPSEKIKDMKYNTSLTLGRIQENFASPDTLSFWELPKFIEFFESSGFSALKHRLHWLTLLISPLMLCSMVLVSAIFSLRTNNRQGKVLYLIVGGITTGFTVYFITNIINALGISGTLPYVIAVIIPPIIISMLSVSALLHLEDG